MYVVAQISQLIAPFFSCDLLLYHLWHLICFPCIPTYIYTHFFSSVDKCFVLLVLLLLAHSSVASHVCHQVCVACPTQPRVLLFLTCQKSGTSLTSAALQMDTIYLLFCTLHSETALTTLRGHNNKCFMLFVTCSQTLFAVSCPVSLLPIPSKREWQYSAQPSCLLVC